MASSSGGTSEGCYYDDTQRGNSLRRIKRLGNKCHHIRWVAFENHGIELVVLYDAFCSPEAHPCSKEPCSEDISVFLRHVPTGIFAGQLTTNIAFLSKTPNLLQFMRPKDRRPKPALKICQTIWPPFLNHRDLWPTAITLAAVRYPQPRENHAFVDLRIEIVDDQKVVDDRSFSMAFRIPRVGECSDDVKQLQTEGIMDSLEVTVVTEALKLLVKDGYDFARRVLGSSPTTDAHAIDPTVASQIQRQLSLAQQKQLFALSQLYQKRTEAVERRIREVEDVRPGVNNVELEEDIGRLKTELAKIAATIGELMPK
jgi:hypothetical protein